jgi:hypothetical protein
MSTWELLSAVAIVEVNVVCLMVIARDLRALRRALEGLRRRVDPKYDADAERG